MSKQGKGTGNVHQLHPDKAAKIEPLDGWTVWTKYGTLRVDKGPDCVRLQDVHSWLMRDGLPAPRATSKLFAPFYEAALKTISPSCDASDELAACKLLASLRLVCADGEPVQLFTGRNKCIWGAEKTVCENMRFVNLLLRTGEIEGRWIEREYVPFITFHQTPHLAAFKANFPDLGHVRFEHDSPAGLIYAMAEGVARVWRGPVVATTDPVLTDSIAKDRADETKYQIKWPSDDALSLALERVAVPIAIAHELWGWGCVSTEQDQATGQPAPVPEATKLKKIKEKDKSPEWTGQKLLARQNELKTQGVKAYAAQTAKEAGISTREASRRIDGVKNGGAVAVIADQLKAAGNKNKAA